MELTILKTQLGTSQKRMISFKSIITICLSQQELVFKAGMKY